MSSSLIRRGTAATATTLLFLAGAATAQAGTTDDASVSEAPAESTDDTEAPVEETEAPTTDDSAGEPADDEPTTEEPVAEEPVAEEPAEEDVPFEGDPTDPALWAAALQAEGISDAACVNAALPADGVFVADKDYLVLIDLFDLDTEEPGFNFWVDIAQGEEYEVGMDVSHEALILCTGTAPANWDDGDDMTGGSDDGSGAEDSDEDAGKGGTTTVGGGSDDSGANLGPVVQTDRPATGANAALTSAGLAMLAAAGLAMSVAGLRRRASSRS